MNGVGNGYNYNHTIDDSFGIGLLRNASTYVRGISGNLGNLTSSIGLVVYGLIPMLCPPSLAASQLKLRL